MNAQLQAVSLGYGVRKLLAAIQIYPTGQLMDIKYDICYPMLLTFMLMMFAFCVKGERLYHRMCSIF